MNTDSLIAIAAIAGGLLLLGALLGGARILRVNPAWLLVSAALVFLNDALLTNLYGSLPNLVPQGNWNWQGKLLALIATLGLAALPAVGWRQSGLTVRQVSEGYQWPLLVSIIYIGLFVFLASVFPNSPTSIETLAFQLTLPGLEEEIFYRGLLLFSLMKAFPSRTTALGVEWGFGAVVSSVLFGLAHAFTYADGAVSIDLMTMALTAGPSMLVVWLALRTRSLVLPVILHNFGNAIFLLL